MGEFEGIKYQPDHTNQARVIGWTSSPGRFPLRVFTTSNLELASYLAANKHRKVSITLSHPTANPSFVFQHDKTIDDEATQFCQGTAMVSAKTLLSVRMGLNKRLLSVRAAKKRALKHMDTETESA